MSRNVPINPNYPSAANLPRWTPFRVVLRGARAVVWENSRYSVTIRTVKVTVAGVSQEATYLGIANFDQSARHDWRDFQRIKNELLGPEWDAFEVYPAESRKVDPSNYFLLWCFDRQIFDVGMNERRVLPPAAAIAPQRELE